MDNMGNNIENCFDYLALRDVPLYKGDLIIGFGHFDEKIPKTCCDLWREGFASKILFTGGIGAGTSNLPCAEADYFLQVSEKYAPEIPKTCFIQENKSTNTGENLKMSQDVLSRINPDFNFNKGIQRVILVANGYRQRRVFLTFGKLFPNIVCRNAPPKSSYSLEKESFAARGESLDQHMLGEVKRLLDYPAKGFILPCDVPAEIVALA